MKYFSLCTSPYERKSNHFMFLCVSSWHGLWLVIQVYRFALDGQFRVSTLRFLPEIITLISLVQVLAKASFKEITFIRDYTKISSPSILHSIVSSPAYQRANNLGKNFSHIKNYPLCHIWALAWSPHWKSLQRTTIWLSLACLLEKGC